MYRKAEPAVRRLINQAPFENVWVSTGLMRKARVVGATLTELFVLLARDLPEHVLEHAELFESMPQLVSSG